MPQVSIDISEDNDGTGEPLEFRLDPACCGLNDITMSLGSDLSVTMSTEQFERLYESARKWWTRSAKEA